MSEFEFKISAADTMPIQRVIRPPSTPNKGRAVYRMETALMPVLQENGWEFVKRNQKDRSICYCRSPGGVVADTFIIRASIPTDETILRLVEEFKRVASLPLGPGDGFCYQARLGFYVKASFYPRGGFHYYTWDDETAAPKGTQWQWNMPPSLGVSVHGVWSAHLFWLYGLDRNLVWQRHAYFSGLIPNVDFRGMAILEPSEGDAETDI